MADTRPIVASLVAGRPAEAERLCRLALAQGATGGLWFLLGHALHAQGRAAEAVAAFDAAVLAAPADAEARYALGVARVATGDVAGAAGAWWAALERAPGHVGAHYNLARALSELGQLEQAADHYQAVLAADPGRIDARYNLGNLLYRRGVWSSAAESLRQVVAAQPDFAQAWVNLGLAEQRQGHADEAERALRRAVALAPDAVDGHWNLALLLMARRRWRDGLAEFEWRLRLPDAPRPDFAVPRWCGDEPAGTRVLVWNDQGAGDALHFARYLRPLLERGHRPLVWCQDGLAPLLAEMFGGIAALGFSAPPPEADVHLPLLSLPYALGLDDPEADWSGPYVSVPSALPPGTRRRVGLVWAGNPGHCDDARRSLDPAVLAPLVADDGVEWLSLQVGAAAAACGRVPLAGRVRDLSAQLTDYRRTAQVVAGLDLVVSVDTSVAHLAGAMGKPVWLLLPASGVDWRWPVAGDRTPLYPTMRLFRQPADGQWPAVVAAVAATLRAG